MAIIHSIPSILKKKYKETYLVENLLIDFFERNLNDEYEVFHRPQLNGDQPPFIIMRKGCGVLLINIFDEPLVKYDIELDSWYYNNLEFISPFSQADGYKNNVYNLHSELLTTLTAINPYHFNIIQTMVFFSEENTSQIKTIIDETKDDKGRFPDPDLKYASYFGYDKIENNDIDYIIRKGKLKQPSKLFTQEIYDSFSRYFTPSFHSMDLGQKLNYSKKQQKLIVSEPKHTKIRGVVGSGKTYVLAKRAVNAHLRTNDDVLILSFNITLRNNIKEMINKVMEDFYWDHFFINNYHNFFNQQALKAGIKVKSLSAYHDIEYFTQYKTQKFDTILIDEIQDYDKNWVINIRKHFLKEGGELVIFGDEKQNIYGRKLEEDKRPYTGIGGEWNLLNESFRSLNSILRIAEKFQSSFLNDKYELDQIYRGIQTEIFEQTEHLGYISLIENNNYSNLKRIYAHINNIIDQYQIHPDDVAILSFSNGLIRELDYLWRSKKHEKTSVAFDSFEVHFNVFIDVAKSYPVVQKGLEFFKQDKTKLVQALGHYLYDKVFGESHLPDFLKTHNIDPYEFKTWQRVFESFYLENSQGTTNINNDEDFNNSKSTTGLSSLKNKFHNKIERIQRNNKVHFKHSGFTKFSTIHSYKGWESHTVFIIMEGPPAISASSATPEKVYTGLTRAMINLFIIDNSVNKFSSFFKENMK